MKIRFKNPFLAICGTGFFFIGYFTGSLISYFMFGWCFGMIYLNYKDDDKKNNS